MISEPSHEAGFSTLEVLIAFLVLSLGLALSVQSISQASLSIKQAELRADRSILLRKLISEELPRIVKAYSGGMLTKNGPSWRIELRPLAVGDGTATVQAIIQLVNKDGKSATETHVQIFPLSEASSQGPSSQAENQSSSK